jgi:8-amino-7-oxononanoate synthase
VSGSLDDFLSRSLSEIESAGLLRKLRKLDSEQGAEVVVDDARLINFSSNDYLGLAAHPRLREAAMAALEKDGTGVGASRLICGNHREHELLDMAIARFKRAEAALSFSTGYAAALGTIPALVGQSDVIVLDKLCHASLVDGARLSGATLRVFPHNDVAKLESHLKWAKEKYPEAKVLVLAESVYSMDGDVAPLAEIVELKDRFGAWLMLDEAHGVGVLGEKGRGLASSLDLDDRVEIQMGTLGKALGAAGAYIAGSAVLREYLINRARSFIFSTAPIPAAAAAARAAIELLESGEGPLLLAQLWENLRAFSPDAVSAIVPIVIGDERLAVESANRLREAGFLVPAIRYPTVARGSARLRVTITAAHSGEQIRQLATALASLNART